MCKMSPCAHITKIAAYYLMNLSSFSSDAKQYSLPLYSAATSGLPGWRLSYLWKKPRVWMTQWQTVLTTVFKSHGFKSQLDPMHTLSFPTLLCSLLISILVLGISTLHSLNECINVPLLSIHIGHRTETLNLKLLWKHGLHISMGPPPGEQLLGRKGSGSIRRDKFVWGSQESIHFCHCSHFVILSSAQETR